MGVSCGVDDRVAAHPQEEVDEVRGHPAFQRERERAANRRRVPRHLPFRENANADHHRRSSSGCLREAEQAATPRSNQPLLGGLMAKEPIDPKGDKGQQSSSDLPRIVAGAATPLDNLGLRVDSAIAAARRADFGTVRTLLQIPPAAVSDADLLDGLIALNEGLLLFQQDRAREAAEMLGKANAVLSHSSDTELRIALALVSDLSTGLSVRAIGVRLLRLNNLTKK